MWLTENLDIREVAAEIDVAFPTAPEDHLRHFLIKNDVKMAMTPVSRTRCQLRFFRVKPVYGHIL